MTRKIPVLFLCTILLFAAGCRKQAAEVSIAPLGNASGLTAEDAADSQNPAADSTPFYTLTPVHHIIQEQTKDGSATLLSGQYDTLKLEAPDFPDLADAVTRWQEDAAVALEQAMTDTLSYAKKQLSQSPELFGGCYISRELTVTRADSRVLSLREYFLTDDGQQFLCSVETINFDADTGALLTLQEVVTDPSAFAAAVADYLPGCFSGDSFSGYSFYEGYERSIAAELYQIPWYFTATGVSLVYNPGSISDDPAAMEIPLPAEIFSSFFKETYHFAATAGFAMIQGNDTLSLGDSNRDLMLRITSPSIGQSDFNAEAPFSFQLNGTEYRLDTNYFALQSCYIVCQQSGRLLLMLDGDLASDDYVTYFYDISDGTAKKFGSVDGSISMPGVNAAKFTMVVQVLGTYLADMAYDLSDDSGPVLSDTEYVLFSASVPLTTSRSLPVSRDGQALSLPEGTSLLPLATDYKSYVRVKDTSTEKEYEISFSMEDYQIVIEGLNDYEYFEMLPYAG